MDGPKDVIRGLLEKFKTVLGKMKIAGVEIKKTEDNLAVSRGWIDALPPSLDRIEMNKEWHELRTEIRPLKATVQKRKKQASDVWEKLKKAAAFFKINIDGVGVSTVPRGLGLIPLIPVLAVAALVASVTFLFNVTVNKTRELNRKSEQLRLAAEGKLTPGQIEALNKKTFRAGGFFGGITQPLILIAAISVLPALLRKA